MLVGWEEEEEETGTELSGEGVELHVGVKEGRKEE